MARTLALLGCVTISLAIGCDNQRYDRPVDRTETEVHRDGNDRPVDVDVKREDDRDRTNVDVKTPIADVDVNDNDPDRTKVDVKTPIGDVKVREGENP